MKNVGFRGKLPPGSDTQQVYKELVQSFAEERAPVNKMWIKGEVVNPGAVATKSVPTNRLYMPTSKFSLPEPQAPPEPPVNFQLEQLSDKPAKVDFKKDGKKKTNLEMFKDELKQMQEQREQRHQLKKYLKEVQEASEGTRKSRFDPAPPPALLTAAAVAPMTSDLSLDASESVFDPDLDRSTTNLFMGNLSPELSEQQLMELFGRYGPLASVKIMWPRTDEERKKNRNCGFVAYMSRRDAEHAIDRLKGRDLLGYEMKVGWGKPVSIPAYPVYIPPALLDYIKPPPESGLPFNSQPLEWLRGRHGPGGSKHLISRDQLSDTSHKPINTSHMSREELAERIKNSVVKVVVPSDRATLCCINRMVEYVVREGHVFEALIMNRELDNPQYRFLFDYYSSEHTYYRWKLYSILHGDTAQRWRLNEFRMYKDGPLWRPPPYNVFTSGMPEHLIEEGELPPMHPNAQGSGSDSLSNSPRGLSPELDITVLKSQRVRAGEISLKLCDRNQLHKLFASLSVKRFSIAEAMVWCLEHAECAADIVEAVCSAVEAADCDADSALAFLFLISDLLHNSSARVSNASHFRTQFERKLQFIFLRLHDLLEGLAIGPSPIRGYKDNFRQQVNAVVRAWEDWALYPRDFLIQLNNNFLGLSAKPVIASTNGAEIVDGLPLVDYDGDPLDLDGEPLAEPDIDGEPINSRTQVSAPVFTTKWESSDSRWERENSAEAPSSALVAYDSDSGSETGSLHSDGGQMSEERRSRLREIELKVTKYQDDLETGRKKVPGVSVQSEVQAFRQRLLQKEDGRSLTRSQGSASGRKKHRQRSRSPNRKHKHR